MGDARTGTSNQILHLAVTWALIIPLLFFAGRGAFWFEDAPGMESVLGMAGDEFNTMSIELRVTAILVFALLCLLMFPHISQISSGCRRNKLFPALALLAISSSVWSQFPIVTLENSLLLAVSTVFAFYLCARFQPKQQLRLIYLLGWMCLALSITLSLFFPQYGLDPVIGSDAWRGMYGYKNACAMPTVFLLITAFYLPARSILAKVSRITFILLSVLVIVMTQSRTGWVLLASLSIYVFSTHILRCFRKWDRVGVALLGTVVFVPIIVVVCFNLSNIFYFLGKDPTMTGRTKIWESVIISAMKRPILGYGYMGFFRGIHGENGNVVLQHGWNVSASHNGFLDIFVTLGVAGLGLILWSFFRAFRDSFRCFFATRSRFLGWCGCIVFLVVVVNFDEKAMMIPDDLIWILYIIACVGLSNGARRVRVGLSYG